MLPIFPTYFSFSLVSCCCVVCYCLLFEMLGFVIFKKAERPGNKKRQSSKFPLFVFATLKKPEKSLS